MTADLQELARRAVACPAWRWLPGMGVKGWPFLSDYDPATQFRCVFGASDDGPAVFVSDEGDVSQLDCILTPHSLTLGLPDFTDPLTVLGVLVLVREALSNQTLTPMRSLAGHWFWSRGTAAGEFTSELDALIAGLEAAPVQS